MRIELDSFQLPWTREQFLAELERGDIAHCHVAVLSRRVEGGDVEGAGSTGPIGGFITAWMAGDELHITNLAVCPAFRRSGIAVSLLERSLDEAAARGARWCQLEVRDSNVPAISLYRRFGFGPLGIRRRYYHDGEDAVVMGRELPQGSLDAS